MLRTNKQLIDWLRKTPTLIVIILRRKISAPMSEPSATLLVSGPCRLHVSHCNRGIFAAAAALSVRGNRQLKARFGTPSSGVKGAYLSG
jgi:hypothetical protein